MSWTHKLEILSQILHELLQKNREKKLWVKENIAEYLKRRLIKEVDMKKYYK